MRIRIGAVFAFFLVLSQLAEASITITYSYTQAYASEADGDSDDQYDDSLDIPFNRTLNAVAGDNSSTTVIDRSYSSGHTILSLDFTHERQGATSTTPKSKSTSSGGTQLLMEFIANSSAPYTLSGFYNVLDVVPGDAGRVYYYAYLYDFDASEWLFYGVNESYHTHNEQFTLGQIGGDQPSSIVSGSLNGNLIVDHHYQINLIVSSTPFGPDSGASALGNVKLRIGQFGAVPEALSIVVWGGLILAAGLVVQCRRHTRK